MKKNKYINHIILVIIISIFMLFCMHTFVNADFNPGEYNIKADDTTVLQTKYSGVIDIIKNIGTYVSVIALILLGIKYMVSSAEEKAEYKEKMAPYIIGATFVFAISQIISIIQTMGIELTSSANVGDVGGKIITILSVVGSLISVIMIIVLGIKYMAGSTEEKAGYKKSMMPYVIGAIFVFASSTIASMVYQMVTNAMA